jgi:diadenosine tetraphosphate (Ap4A) HIT family hydrolase
MSCVLCEQPGGIVVWQDACCRVVLPDEPGYPGFVRVIAQTHVREMSDLPQDQRSHVMDVVWRVEQVVREVMMPTKINVASLGNVVAHVHWHVIARFEADAHFPGSIWSQVQRTPTQEDSREWQDRARGLPEALLAAFSS